MGVAQDDNIKPFQKLLMSKGLEGRGGSGWTSHDILITHVTQFLGHSARNTRTCKMDETIGDGFLRILLKVR